MRRISTLFVSLLIALSTMAQSYSLNEGFESAAFPPAGWKTIDKDLDGNCWLLGGTELDRHSGNNVAVSYTIDPVTYENYGEQDNWLITPQVEITNNAYILRLYYAAEDINTKEQIVVKVSTTGNNVADFTDEILSGVADNGFESEVQFTELSYSLSKYAGKKIYVAIIHKGRSTYALGVDDVSIANMYGPQPISGLSSSVSGNSVTLSWTNPSFNGNGETLSGVDINIYRDDILLTTITNAALGERASYTDTNVPTGNHTYAVSAANNEGESLKRYRTIYSGEDIPSTVNNLNAAVENKKAILSWSAPTRGANYGNISSENLTYNIYKVVDGITSLLATDITATTYQADLTPDKLTIFSVSAVSGAGEGATANSNAVIAFDSQYTDIAIGNDGTAYGGNARIPIDLYGGRTSISQSIYYPEELKNAKGKINHIVYKNGFSAYVNARERNIKVWMSETTQENLTGGWIPTAEATLVFDGTITLNPGSNDLPVALSTPFNYNGGNLVVTVLTEIQTGIGNYFDLFYVSTTANHSNRTRYFVSDSEISTNALDPNSSITNQIPTTRFIMEAEGIASVSGMVKSESEGKPLKNATVSIEDLGISATTDAEGKYLLAIVPSGLQTFKVEAVGYQDKTESVSVPDKGSLNHDFVLSEMPAITLKGKIVSEDDNTSLAGALVSVTGYDEIETTTNADGTFTLEGVFPNKRYTLSVAMPEYDIYSNVLNGLSADTDFGVIALKRSLIAPFDVTTTLTDNGLSRNIAWQSPLSRSGKIQWTRINDTDTQTSSSKEYYSEDDYCVAHYWSAADLQQAEMTGMSIGQMRIYIKAPKEGTFTALVWRGNRNQHEVLESKVIPLDEISPDGGWVTASFNAPVELKAGNDYMVGIRIQGSPTSEIGINGDTSEMEEGRNNLRFTDAPGSFTYNGSFAYNISANIVIPGSDLMVSQPGNAPKCSYNIYRSSGNSWTKLNSNDLTSEEFSDTGWENLAQGEYQYKVEAVYPKGTSSPAYSDITMRNVNYDAGIASFVSPLRTADKQTEANIVVAVENYGERSLTSIPVEVDVDGNILKATYTGNLKKGETANVEVGSVSLTEEKVYTLKATTTMNSDENAANNELSMTLSNLNNVVLHGIRFWDIINQSGPVTINTNVPEQTTLLKTVYPNDNIIAAGDVADGTFYGYTLNSEVYYYYSGAISPSQFVTIDTITWTTTKAIDTEEYVYDMTYDYSTKTMFALRYAGDNAPTELAKVDLSTGQLETVGSTGYTLRTIAANSEGQLYAIAEGGILAMVDKNSGSVSIVDNTGISDVRYLQSMAFDHNSGRLFWVQTGDNTFGHLHEINASTAEATSLGEIRCNGNESEIVALYSSSKPSADRINPLVVQSSEMPANSIYGVNGVKRNSLQHGVNIVKTSEGRIVKVIR